MRIVTLLMASLTLLASVAATAEVDVQPGEYVVFYHHDVLGSPVTATNEQGQVIWYERTASYGKSEGRVSNNGNPFGDNAVPAGDSRQGYTGHTLDNSAGLTYMKARYYDHNIGRFLSNDPVGFSFQNPTNSFNRYAYAGNNPYKYVDPDGEFLVKAIAVAAVGYASYSGYKSNGVTGAVAEASGYNDAVESMNELVDGNYTGAAIAAASIVCKACKGASNIPRGGTYKLRDPETGQVRRTGMTNDLERRRREHDNDNVTEDLDFEVDRRSDSRAARRGREQRIHDEHPEADLNYRNPIDPNNPKRDELLKEGDKLLKRR